MRSRVCKLFNNLSVKHSKSFAGLKFLSSDNNENNPKNKNIKSNYAQFSPRKFFTAFTLAGEAETSRKGEKMERTQTEPIKTFSENFESLNKFWCFKNQLRRFI